MNGSRGCLLAKRGPIVAGVVALALLASLAPGAAADTKTDLAGAKAQLSALATRIAAQQAAVSSLQSQLNEMADALAGARATYERTQADLAVTRAALAAAGRRFRALQARLDRRAAAIYIEGPGSTIEMLLGAASLADLTDRLEYSNRLSGDDAALALAVQRRAEDLGRQRDRLAALEAAQSKQLEDLGAQNDALAAAFVRQQQQLADLAASRTEAAALVTKLAKKLRAEELAAARAAAFGGMTISFGRWAGYALPRLGASGCRNNLVVMVAWETAEYTSARWNPLATTYPMPGASSYNGFGVRNYVSLDQGLQATAATLALPSRGYEPILGNLRGCADPMATGRAINASLWCRGCAGGGYVTNFIPAVEAYYDRYAGATSPHG